MHKDRKKSPLVGARKQERRKGCLSQPYSATIRNLGRPEAFELRRVVS